MLKGGDTKSFGVNFARYLEVLAILGHSFHPLKGGAQKVLSLCHIKRFPTDYERLKNTKIGEKNW